MRMRCGLALGLLFAGWTVWADPVSGSDTPEAQRGLIDLRVDAAKARVEIGIHALDEPMLMVSALPGALGSNDVGLDRAQVGEPRVVVFRQLGTKLLLVQRNTRFVADSADADEVKAARDAFAEAVLWSGELSASKDASGTHWADATGLAVADWHGVADRLRQSGQGGYAVDAMRSGLIAEHTRSYPDNTVFEALLTFAGEGGGGFVQQVAADAKTLSLRQQLNFVRLPAHGAFTPRRYHPASGGWSVGAFDFAQPLTQSLQVRWQARFRLEKTDPTAARSTVVKPIVFYLDRGTPEPVRSALLEGANRWAAAFDAAGFIDAFRAELAPEGMDLADIRYNAITWTHRATRGWSYGGGVVDPRTGEILKGYVNLGSQRVRQDLLIAEGLLAPYAKDADPAARQQAIDMALSRLRQLAAHEVGHALGFAHNFAASRTGNGSVMDYPHPAIALDAQGRVQLADPYRSGVGDWDRFLVAHAYGVFPSSGETDALAGLRRDIAARGYRYVSDADARAPGDAHPEGLLWDVAGDPIVGLSHLLAVRQAALSRFADGALPPDRPRSERARRLVPIHLLHRYQTEAVARLLGGVEYDFGLAADAASTLRPVAPSRQRAALSALAETLSLRTLTLPDSVLRTLLPLEPDDAATPEFITGQSGPVFDEGAATAVATAVVAQFALAAPRLNRMAAQHAHDPASPGPGDVFDRLIADPWRADERGADWVRRSRNWVLVDAALHVLADGGLSAAVESDWRTRLRAFAQSLASHGGDAREAARLIRQYLDAPTTVSLRPLPVVPPGAPI